MHQMLLPFQDREFHLTLLGSCIQYMCREPKTAGQIIDGLKSLHVIFWPGDVSEVVWRLGRMGYLRETSDGRVHTVPLSHRSVLPPGTLRTLCRDREASERATPPTRLHTT